MATAESATWTRILQDFTERNTGRATRIEEDGPDIGAQVEEMRWPLRGVAYDPRANTVDIMVGDLGTADGHLTRSVRGVDAVDVLTGPDGRDMALRVGHEGGQTLLRLIG